MIYSLLCLILIHNCRPPFHSPHNPTKYNMVYFLILFWLYLWFIIINIYCIIIMINIYPQLLPPLPSPPIKMLAKSWLICCANCRPPFHSPHNPTKYNMVYFLILFCLYLWFIIINIYSLH